MTQFSEDTLKALARDVMEVSKTEEAKKNKWTMGFIISMVCERNKRLTKAVAAHMQARATNVRNCKSVIAKVRRERELGQQHLFKS